MNGTTPSFWVACAIQRIDKLECHSIADAECKALARRLVSFAEIGHGKLTAPSVWREPIAGAITLQWACPMNMRGTLEIVVSGPTSVQISLWVPGKPNAVRVMQGDWADGMRTVIAEFLGESVGCGVDEMMKLTEVKR